MTIIEILKQLDLIALQANRTWNQCESLKLMIAEKNGISDKKLKDNGIYVPETKNAPPGIPNEA